MKTQTLRTLLIFGVTSFLMVAFQNCTGFKAKAILNQSTDSSHGIGTTGLSHELLIQLTSRTEGLVSIDRISCEVRLGTGFCSAASILTGQVGGVESDRALRLETATGTMACLSNGSFGLALTNPNDPSLAWVGLNPVLVTVVEAADCVTSDVNSIGSFELVGQCPAGAENINGECVIPSASQGSVSVTNIETLAGGCRGTAEIRIDSVQPGKKIAVITSNPSSQSYMIGCFEGPDYATRAFDFTGSERIHLVETEDCNTNLPYSSIAESELVNCESAAPRNVALSNVSSIDIPGVGCGLRAQLDIQNVDRDVFVGTSRLQDPWSIAVVDRARFSPNQGPSRTHVTSLMDAVLEEPGYWLVTAFVDEGNELFTPYAQAVVYCRQ